MLVENYSFLPDSEVEAALVFAAHEVRGEDVTVLVRHGKGGGCIGFCVDLGDSEFHVDIILPLSIDISWNLSADQHIGFLVWTAAHEFRHIHQIINGVDMSDSAFIERDASEHAEIRYKQFEKGGWS